ncbi:nucleotidyltransferase family protein [Pseudarthrobacter sp. J64]|uniref:nucleotidyltransferase family protein n=1 Tax=Pseudarthrobacter sp. J64 TaxID=3116485 RepID=UPI002E7FC565|nr:nucleotidyltransferase family protein [Pseudarthrobacter sp. J64]MEE2567921.1 nucleotidyltransferase family protein [Pseudarthrobacter sp. J64]
MTEHPVGTEAHAQLRLDEAVLLCHVLTSHIADRAGVRAIFIKGPVSALQGLRKPRRSVDVDVLVDPNAVADMVDALLERGWELRPAEPDTTAFPRHSETLFHRSWPSDIDVHYRFPGMERDAVGCFNAMWDHTETRVVAGHAIRVPNRPLAICVLALHGLRTPWAPSSRTELDYLASLPLQHEQREIMAVAEQTGATAALSPFLEAAFGPGSVGPVPEPSPEWTRRVVASAPGTSRTIALMSAPWRQKPRLVMNALFPSKATLLAKDIYADVSLRGRMRLYVRRWQGLMSSLPQYFGDIKKYYRSTR